MVVDRLRFRRRHLAPGAARVLPGRDYRESACNPLVVSGDACGFPAFGSVDAQARDVRMSIRYNRGVLAEFNGEEIGFLNGNSGNDEE